MIKKSSHVISPVLANYFNKLMTSGTFPDVLKVGRITPIFKKDNPECIENYRPISTLPIFGKIYILFADDTNIFVEGKTAANAYEKGNQLLKSLYRYMISNKLHINMSKCCLIHFKPTKKQKFK